MGHDAARRWTAAEFLALPEDRRRVELLDGEIVVTSPTVRHEAVGMRLGVSFFQHVTPLGGRAFSGILDVPVDGANVVQPDVLVFLPEHVDRLGVKRVEGPPDLAVEVDSPSTKGRDRLKKRMMYERLGVAEFWIVDLDQDVIEVYRLGQDGYGPPVRFGRGDTVTTPLLPGWSAEVDWLLPTLA